jgi:hypothetical protein
MIEETEALEVYDFVALLPVLRPTHAVEITRREDRGLEVRVPGRPPMIPELAVERREALRSREFASEDPADATRPWVRQAPNAEEAVRLARQVLEEVFEEKPDVRLDLTHGSHRAEHEVREKLASARTRIERVAQDMLGHAAERDEDGDYVLPIGDVHVMVAPRPAPANRVLVRIFAITNVGITLMPELGLLLARLNFGLMIGRFSLDAERGSIWFDETLLTEHFEDDELRWVIELVAATADQWDDQLKRMFGGATHQEVITGRAAQSPASSKPGGVGQYL